MPIRAPGRGRWTFSSGVAVVQPMLDEHGNPVIYQLPVDKVDYDAVRERMREAKLDHWRWVQAALEGRCVRRGDQPRADSGRHRALMRSRRATLAPRHGVRSGGKRSPGARSVGKPGDGARTARSGNDG